MRFGLEYRPSQQAGNLQPVWNTILWGCWSIVRRYFVLPWTAEFSTPPLKFGILLFRTEGYPNSCLDTFIQSKRQPKFYISVIFCAAKYEKSGSNMSKSGSNFRLQTKFRLCCRLNLDSNLSTVGILAMAMVQGIVAMVQFQHTFSSIILVKF